MPPALPAWARTPPRDGPAYLLKLLEEDGTVEQFPISRKAGYLLGRNAKECDLAVDDKSVSRVHACVCHDPEHGVFLVDLGSAHGTMVDGDRLQDNQRVLLLPDRTRFTMGICPVVFSLVVDRGRSGSEGRGTRERRGEAEQYRGSWHGRKGNAGPYGRGERAWERARPMERRLPRDWVRPRGHEGAPRVRDRQQPGQDSYLEDRNQPSRIEPPARSPSADRAPDPSVAHRDNGDAQQAALGNTGAESNGRDGEVPDERTAASKWADLSPEPSAEKVPDAVEAARNGARSSDKGEMLTSNDAEPGTLHAPQAFGNDAKMEDASEGSRRDRRRQHHPEKRRRSRSADHGEERRKKRQHHSKHDRRNDGRRSSRDRRRSRDRREPPARERRMEFVDARGSGPAMAAQKKKLLWGTKPDPDEGEDAKTYGANRWDVAEFSREQDKAKFMSLLGVKRSTVPTVEPEPAAEPAPVSPAHGEHTVLKGAEKEKMLHEVETHFMQGLRRAVGGFGRTGLGI